MDTLKNVHAVSYNLKLPSYSKSSHSARSTAEIVDRQTLTQDAPEKSFDKKSGVLSLKDELTNIQKSITKLQEIKHSPEGKNNLSEMGDSEAVLYKLSTHNEIKSDVVVTYDKTEKSLKNIANRSIYISSQIDALSSKLEGMLMEINTKPLVENEISEVVNKIKKSFKVKNANSILTSGGISAKKAAFLLGL